MHLPILSLTFLLGLSAAIAVPAPNPDSALEAKDFIPNTVLRQVIPRQGIPLPEPEEDIEPPRDDGLVPFAGGGPVVGKWVKPTFTPGPEDNVLPFSNSVVSWGGGFFACFCFCFVVFLFVGGEGRRERRRKRNGGLDFSISFIDLIFFG